MLTTMSSFVVVVSMLTTTSFVVVVIMLTIISPLWGLSIRWLGNNYGAVSSKGQAIVADGDQVRTWRSACGYGEVYCTIALGVSGYAFQH